MFFWEIVTPCVAQTTYQYQIPVTSNDGWKTTSLVDYDADTSVLFGVLDTLSRVEHQIHSVLVFKENQLVLEEYFGRHQMEQQHDLRSVTKSVFSLLVGIAVDQGYIQDINDPITKYLKTPQAKKNLSDRKAQITIKNLLTMSAGWDCNDWDKRSKGQEDRIYKKKDWLQYTVDLPMVSNPGNSPTYCTMGVTLAAEIVTQATGMSVDSFADRHLFKPLGITNYAWGHTSDRKGIKPSAKRLYMRSRDLGKLGQLVLQEGEWNGQWIISKQWIEEATQQQVVLANTPYGYLWWNFTFDTPKGNYIAKAATGNGGQYCMVFEALDLVIVFTGGAYNSAADKWPFMFIRNVLLPAFAKQ